MKSMNPSGVLCVCITISLLFTDCSIQAAPSKPKLSSFSAMVSLLGPGQQIDNINFYSNVEDKKMLQVIPYGRDPNSNVKQYTWDITKGNKTTEYVSIKPIEYCSGSDYDTDPSMYDIWYWLKNANYTGQKQFTVHHLDTWSYEDKDDGSFYEVGVSTTNPNLPVYLFSSNIGVIVFHKYDGTAPSASMFDIPKNCSTMSSSYENQESSAFKGATNVFKIKI